MTLSALEAKINKIKQQNEEIRRRHKEVEEDKKNAAKLNALVQMVPSTDWPERKEPPEFTNPPKTKQKPTKEKHEYTLQAHPNEGKKIHTFAQGEGPPPDPKYNFLADSEREEPGSDYTKEPSGNRSQNRITRGNFRKKIGGREPAQKDNKMYKGNYRDESQPGYDAWRAERNRIDEDRISRQRTAEGNWRREWDNDKMHIVDDSMKKTTRPTLSDFTKKEHKDSDRRYHTNNNEHTNHTRGTHRPHRGTSKNFYDKYDNRPHNAYDQHRNNSTTTKAPSSSTSEDRTVIATEKSIKVTVNQGSLSKGPVMSVKVNSPNIAGTGRVGPRQRTRITYSHSDAEVPMSEGEPFSRQKSFEDKSKGSYTNNLKSSSIKRSHSQKKKESDSKYLYHQRKETTKEDSDTNSQRHHENDFKSPNDSQASDIAKSPNATRRIIEIMKKDPSNENVSDNNETQECSNLDSGTVENNITPESSETMDTSKLSASDQIEASNIDNEEVNNDKNEITNEVTIEKEVTDVVVTLLSGMEALEHVEDETHEETFHGKSECSQELANKSTEDLQENATTSSEASILNSAQSNEERMPNESNNNELEVSSKDDEQSVQNVSEQLVNDDCDNIKDETTAQQSACTATDNPVSSLEAETHSVIEINNESVSNDESMQEETSNVENNELFNENLKDVTNSIETNLKNTPSDTNVKENPTEENNEKSEDIKDVKGEL